MFIIKVSEELKNKCPDFKGIAVEAWVTNTSYNKKLWQEIDTYTQQLRAESNVDDCKEQYAIAATRKAYRQLGKDPSRYRPSAEALRRRLLRGLDLYQIDTLVDIINLVSLKTGFSIGGFDADKIEGEKLVLGVGREGEPYEGIGRGVLNIEGLPVYRDTLGGIGTPTSDNERTKMDVNTVHLLAIINGYSGDKGLTDAADFLLNLLKEYASMSNSSIAYFE
ncbi:MAG: hypothetical protein K5856_03885 [Bacteroidaceae bacterium]|nr:hypothetical protein [Bacteroidaceae bacterium]